MLRPLSSSPLFQSRKLLKSTQREKEKAFYEKLIQSKNVGAFIVLPVALAFFVLPQRAQAVSPAPDGGYAGANTAEGQNALQSLTSGTNNTALGFQALYHDTTGSNNAAEGLRALFSNTGGSSNTATGSGALHGNTTGGFNAANGAFALFSNTTGGSNTATGADALFSNTTGGFNTANGFEALFSNTIGINNTATGERALVSNTTGSDNTGNGSGALVSNTTGGANTATGFAALHNNTAGFQNTANGVQALIGNTNGNANTANGFRALFSNTIGNNNTAIGYQALFNNTTGGDNIALGVVAGGSVTTANNVICIGDAVSGANVSNSCFIGNIFNATSPGGVAVFVNSAGQLGTSTSSRRFKKEIKPMDKASGAILALKPVTFHYKSDNTNTPQFGLIAEEVADVNPDLVVRDENGEIYTVRYEAVNAMLLNEFLKEYRKVEEQQATIGRLEATVTRQEKGLQTVTARLDQQAAQIQKVSTQLEASKPAPHVVNNP
jgi:hypothetical protein